MRTYELRPLVVDIAAPQVLVFEMASAVNGTLPGSPPHSAELLDRDGDRLIVQYRTPAYVTELVFVERVHLYPPERIEYEVLEGPLDLVREHLAFDAVDPHRTRVRYGGIVGSGRPLVGTLLARWIAVPAYDRFMRRQLAALKAAAEARAVRSRRFPRPDAA
jgi:hypothetical protein